MKYICHNLEDAWRFLEENLSPYQIAANTEEDSLSNEARQNSIISDI